MRTHLRQALRHLPAQPDGASGNDCHAPAKIEEFPGVHSASRDRHNWKRPAPNFTEVLKTKHLQSEKSDARHSAGALLPVDRTARISFASVAPFSLRRFAHHRLDSAMAFNSIEIRNQASLPTGFPASEEPR